MVLALLPSLVAAAVTVALAAGAVLARALTPAAGAVAAAFGIVIVVFAGFPYLFLLILFVVASSLATRFRFAEKMRRKLQEGKAGERGVPNVIAHILVPLALAVAAGWNPPLLPLASASVLYTSALAFGSSDTFASEFGVLEGRARSILTGRPVPSGTNGGVSASGEAWGLVGALAAGLSGFFLFYLFGAPLPAGGLLFAIATASGFIACQIDSILGETLENRGYLTKGSTNFLGMVSAVLLAAGLLTVFGRPL